MNKPFVSVLDSQRNQPNYLRDVFPRQIHAWHTFTEKDQELFHGDEIIRLKQDKYTENKDKSYSIK